MYADVCLRMLTDADGWVKVDLPAPAKFSNWALAEAAIDPEAKPKIFGAKSTNIVKSRRMLPEWIQVLSRAYADVC